VLITHFITHIPQTRNEPVLAARPTPSANWFEVGVQPPTASDVDITARFQVKTSKSKKHKTDKSTGKKERKLEKKRRKAQVDVGEVEGKDDGDGGNGLGLLGCYSDGDD
jgi:hypothetical protein